MSRILRAAAVVMFGFLLAKITALLRQQIIARAIGTTPEADAYFAAFTAPDLIFMLISGGALATAFIPIFSEYLGSSEAQKSAAWRMASNVLTLSLLASLVVAAIAAVAAPWIVPAIAPGFEPATQALTADLMRIILISTVIFSISGLVTGVLHSLQHFVLPAFAPAIYNVGIIFGALVLVPEMGIAGLAWGSVVGALLHLGIQIPALLTRRIHLRPVFDLRDPGLRRVALLMAPRAATLALIYYKFIIRLNFGSQLGPGTVSSIDYAWDLMQLPETLFATAVATAVFPTLAELTGPEQRQKLADTFNYALRTILALTIPAAVGVLLLSLPIVRAFYERGEFTFEASLTTSNALNFFAFGIVGHGLLEIVARLYYARKDTLRPLMAAAVMLLVTYSVTLLTLDTLGVSAIALGDTVGVFVESAILLWLLRARLPEALSRLTQSATLKVGAASAAMGVAILLWLQFIGERSQYLVAGGGILIGIVVFAGVALLLGVEEIRQMPRLMLRRA